VTALLLIIIVLLAIIWWQIAADARLIRRALDIQTQRILQALNQIAGYVERLPPPPPAPDDWADDLIAKHSDRP